MSNNKIWFLTLIIILYCLGLVHGYCLSHLVEKAVEEEEVVSGDRILYTIENVNVRIAPNKDAEIKTILPKGTSVVQVLPEDSLWETVHISGDESGEYYIYKAFLVDTILQESGDASLSGEQIQQKEVKEVEIEQVSTSNLLSITSFVVDDIQEEEKIKVNNKADELYGYFTITYYCACSKCCGPCASGITASGTKVQAGRTIAASSKYPFRTQMKINNHIYTVEDRGGTIQGNKIDIYVDSHEEALKLGKQTNVPVYKVK